MATIATTMTITEPAATGKINVARLAGAAVGVGEGVEEGMVADVILVKASTRKHSSQLETSKFLLPVRQESLPQTPHPYC